MLAVLGLLVMTGAAYYPAARAGFVWDDESYITHSRNERTPGDLWRIWTDPRSVPQYYPLVHTMFWVEYHLWGDRPAGYHVINIALHALGAVLLWRVLRRLKVPGAWLAAAIFAVHPIHVETVAWATERKNVLSGALAMGAMLALLRFYGVGDSKAKPPTGGTVAMGEQSEASTTGLNWSAYLCALVLFVAAVLSKTVVSVLPVVVVMLLWWKGRPLDRRHLLPLAPMLVVGAIFGSLTATLEKFHVGAIGQDWDFSLLERCLIAGRAFWFYIGKLLWPHPLVFVYPRWTIEAASAAAYIWPVAAAALFASFAALSSRFGRGMLVALGVFVVGLAPASGFFDVYPMRFSFVADHFVYLASVGVIVLGVAGASRGLSNRSRPVRIAAVSLAAVLLLVLGGLTWSRCHDYRDAQTLWLDTVEKNPGAMIGLHNLATMRFDEGRFDEALRYLEQARDARPKHPLAYETLGWFYEKRGEGDRAMEYYRRSIACYSGDEPQRGVAHQGLGRLLAERGDDAAAVEEFRRALRCRPWADEVTGLLGRSLLRLGRFEEAGGALERFIATRPTDVTALFALGSAYQKTGRLQLAAEHYMRVLQLDAAHAGAHNNLGAMHAAAGRAQVAIEHFAQAVKINEQDVSARMNLGMALAAAGRRDEAKVQLSDVLAREPDSVRGLLAMAQLLAGERGATAEVYDEAIALARRACELTERKDFMSLQTLAVVLRQAGRRAEGDKAMEEAARLAEAHGGHDVAKRLRANWAGETQPPPPAP